MRQDDMSRQKFAEYDRASAFTGDKAVFKQEGVYLRLPHGWDAFAIDTPDGMLIYVPCRGGFGGIFDYSVREQDTRNLRGENT